MQTIHLEYLGKSARVSLQSLPDAKQRPEVKARTSTGELTSQRVTNGVYAKVDLLKLTPAEIIAADPELQFSSAGRVLESDSLSVAYFDPADEVATPVSQFNIIDVVYDATGTEKEKRPHVTRRPNLNEMHPIKIGKRIPLEQGLAQFVFKHTFQLVHVDGLTFDFLFGLSKDLHEKKDLALLGAGAKGNQPLIVREKGSPYRGFLFGEIGAGADKDRYKLLMLLSDQELKRPAPVAASPEAGA
jgi:hypothetical protein